MARNPSTPPLESLRISAAGSDARRTPQLPGRSLEPFSDERPRGMTVSGGNAVQNSAYRSGISCGLQVREDLKAFNFCCERSFALLRSGFRLRAHACIAPQLAFNFCCKRSFALLRSGFRLRAQTPARRLNLRPSRSRGSEGLQFFAARDPSRCCAQDFGCRLTPARRLNLPSIFAARDPSRCCAQDFGCRLTPA